MIFQLPNMLDPETLRHVRSIAEKAPFVGGLQSAGRDVAKAKHNQEVQLSSEALSQLNEIISKKLHDNSDFQIITQARNLSNIIISSYETGMHYGDHSDSAFMRDGTMRSDLSFTFF